MDKSISFKPSTENFNLWTPIMDWKENELTTLIDSFVTPILKKTDKKVEALFVSPEENVNNKRIYSFITPPKKKIRKRLNDSFEDSESESLEAKVLPTRIKVKTDNLELKQDLIEWKTDKRTPYCQARIKENSFYCGTTESIDSQSYANEKMPQNDTPCKRTINLDFHEEDEFYECEKTEELSDEDNKTPVPHHPSLEPTPIFNRQNSDL